MDNTRIDWADMTWNPVTGCRNGCRYCYATRSPATAARQYAAHHPQSPMLTGWPEEDWVLTEKRPPSLKREQLSLF